MRLEVIKNFLTKTECSLLSEWATLGVESGWISTGVAKNRLTSRFYGELFTTPPEILAISSRVRDACGISKYPLIEGHGRDGIVVSYTDEGGFVFKHVDGPSKDGIATLRCNIITQLQESGGVLHIEGQPVDVGVGDLHCYLVSEHLHWVTTIEGKTPRILYMFGAHVPADDWNSGKIEIKNPNDHY